MALAPGHARMAGFPVSDLDPLAIRIGLVEGRELFMDLRQALVGDHQEKICLPGELLPDFLRCRLRRGPFYRNPLDSKGMRAGRAQDRVVEAGHPGSDNRPRCPCASSWLEWSTQMASGAAQAVEASRKSTPKAKPTIRFKINIFFSFLCVYSPSIYTPDYRKYYRILHQPHNFCWLSRDAKRNRPTKRYAPYTVLFSQEKSCRTFFNARQLPI